MARTIGPAAPAPRVKIGGVMSADEFAACLARLGFTISSAGRFFRVNNRTAFDWAKRGPPAPVAVALLLMIGADIGAVRADALVASAAIPRPYRKAS